MSITSLSGYLYMDESPVTTANIDRCLPQYPPYSSNKSYRLELVPNTSRGKFDLCWVEIEQIEEN